MSDDVRADARRLLQGITPGEWVAEPWEGTTREAVGVFSGSVWGPRVAGLIESEADAEFIAAAPALVDRLLAELETRKVWVVLSHCYEDVRVEAVYTSREQAEAAWPEEDENGFSTGYQIVEQQVRDRHGHGPSTMKKVTDV